MTDLDNPAIFFAPGSNRKGVKSATPSKLASSAFSTIHKKPQQRALRRKRQVEEYEHYAAIVFDEEGCCHLLSSPSFKRQKRSILAEAVNRAQEVLEGISGSRKGRDDHAGEKSEHNESLATQTPITGSISYPFDSKRRRVVLERAKLQYNNDSTTAKLEDTTSDTTGTKQSQVKKDMPFPSKLQPIRIDDTPSWNAWYLDGFTTIQQTACRTIAKEWIKAIHPKKQSTHPYNGKIPRSEGASPNPERTRPPYWPPYVRHKEPDHIDKSDRTALLVHLLMHTPQEEIVPDRANPDKTFTAKDLLEVLRKKQDEGVISKWRIIEELIGAREVVENYEAGGIDGDAVLHVPDWGEVLRAAGPKKRGNSTSQPKNHSEEDPDDVYDEMQVQEDRGMADDLPDSSAPAQQMLRQTSYDARVDKPANLMKSFTGKEEMLLHQLSATGQQQAIQNSFTNPNVTYPKSLTSNDAESHESITANSLVPQDNSTNNLATYGNPNWQSERPNGGDMRNGFEAMSSFARSQDAVDPTQFAAAHPHGQLPLGHAMLTPNPYGTNDNYSYDVGQVADGSYDFHRLGQYHQMGYDPQYDLGRHYEGL